MTRAATDFPSRILFISHDGDLGGAQLALRDTVVALQDAGVQVHVLVPGSTNTGPLREQLVQRGITVHSGRVGLWALPPGAARPGPIASLVALIRASCETALLIRRLGVTLVISNTGLLASGGLAARATRRQHVWWLHERQQRDDPLDHLLPLSWTRMAIRRLGEVLVPSEHLADETRLWMRADGVHVVSPFLDLPPALTEPQLTAAATTSPYRILFPGGLLSVKRPLDLLEAVGLLGPTSPYAVVSVIGHDGPERAAAELAISRHGLRERVEVRGFQPGLAKDLTPGTVLVSSGACETFGRVLVEAMAAGIPVVAASSGATTEVVEDGLTGLLYPVGDAGAMASQLLRLVDDPALRERLIRSAYHTARNRWAVQHHLDELALAVSGLSST